MERLLRPVGTEVVLLDDAVGRVCAETVVARVEAPPFAVAAMDGYALRWIDAGRPLRCHGIIRAGDPIGDVLEAGTCRRIFTGAPIPPGADTVVIQELAEADGSWVRIRSGADPHRHIRAGGSNFRSGAPIVGPGIRLTARHIGLIAAAGHGEVRLYRRPRIAILSTGSELSGSISEGQDAQILDANRPALKALVWSWGGVAVDLGIATDDAIALTGILTRTSTNEGIDLLVTSGGASVGDFDLLGPTLAALGFEAAFGRVRMRPGKATLFGQLDGLPVLGLPGNAVAALVSALVFLKPTLSVLAGCGFLEGIREEAILSTPLAAAGSRVVFVRGRIDRRAAGLPTFASFPDQDTAMLASLTEAGGLVERQAKAPAVNPGARVTIMAFDRIPGF